MASTFEIQLTPAEANHPGTGRFTFTKSWAGDMVGTSSGEMLSAGDPGAGNAGYVAIEVFDGSVDGRVGTVVFTQLGTMTDGEASLDYRIAPGSGTGDLAGLTGALVLEIDSDGTHRVRLAP